jgi:hypothetical protein
LDLARIDIQKRSANQRTDGIPPRLPRNAFYSLAIPCVTDTIERNVRAVCSIDASVGSRAR